MKVAFFSDTHLGHRRFSHVDERTGLNVRELDVMQTFQRVLKSIAREQPDVVLHGGDFFDMVRPSNHTILKAFSLLTDFQRERDGAEFVVIAGNHEVPRVVGTGCILELFEQVQGVRALWKSADEVVVERDGERVSILCVPHNRFEALSSIQSRGGSADRRLLLVHGVTPNVRGVGEWDVDVSSLHDVFDLILLGDYHIHRKEGRNGVYVGSTDYVSTNIWEEAGKPKGWILLDTQTMEWTFREVEPTRAVFDLEQIDASKFSVAEVIDRMVRAMEGLQAKHKWPEDRRPIVRQRVLNAPEGFRRDIPFETWQLLYSIALEYSLDTPKKTADPKQQATVGETERPVSDSWVAFAGQYELPEEVDREEFVSTGLHYLKEARDAAEADSS